MVKEIIAEICPSRCWQKAREEGKNRVAMAQPLLGTVLPRRYIPPSYSWRPWLPRGTCGAVHVCGTRERLRTSVAATTASINWDDMETARRVAGNREREIERMGHGGQGGSIRIEGVSS